MTARSKSVDLLWETTKGISGVGSQSSTENQDQLQFLIGQVVNRAISIPTSAYPLIADLIITAFKIGKESK